MSSTTAEEDESLIERQIRSEASFCFQAFRRFLLNHSRLLHNLVKIYVSAVSANA